MFILFCAMILLSLDSLAFRTEAHASAPKDCVTFTLVFDRDVKHMPTTLYLDKTVVGEVVQRPKGHGSPREAVV